MMACLLAFVGCQNEELVNDNSIDNGGEKVILTANIQGAADSRVALTPATDANDKSIVKVEWEESDEKFKVYGVDEYGGPISPTWFTQIAGTNQFEGTLPATDNGTYLAVYGDDLKSTDMPIQYSLYEQDGTLYQRNEDYSIVLMGAEFSSSSPSITFQHMTAILKPTFKVDGKSINSTITQIVMGNVIYPTTANFGIEDITIAPTSPATNIYIHLPIIYIPDGKYLAGHEFTFTVTAGSKEYTATLAIPTGMSIEAGKFYTANINLTEVCTLPTGHNFRSAILSVLDVNDDPVVTAIEFVANCSDDDMDEAQISLVIICHPMRSTRL